MTVTFRMYQINFQGDPGDEYRKYRRCIRSILWKPYRVRRRKERRKEHLGGLPGALMRMESGHGVEFGNWKQQNLRFWDGSAIPFCFSSANLFYSWETVFYNEKRSARIAESVPAKRGYCVGVEDAACAAAAGREPRTPAPPSAPCRRCGSIRRRALGIC